MNGYQKNLDEIVRHALRILDGLSIDEKRKVIDEAFKELETGRARRPEIYCMRCDVAHSSENSNERCSGEWLHAWIPR